MTDQFCGRRGGNCQCTSVEECINERRPSPANAEMSLIEAGDDLYSAFCDYGKTKGQVEALTNYANASNAYRGGVIRAQQMRWRPMEAAPRDGTSILIRRHNDVCWDYFVAWHVTGDDKYPWHSDNNAYPEHRCDDWMAIPDALPECGGSA